MPTAERRFADPFAESYTERYWAALVVVAVGAAIAAWRLELFTF